MRTGRWGDLRCVVINFDLSTRNKHGDYLLIILSWSQIEPFGNGLVYSDLYCSELEHS